MASILIKKLDPCPHCGAPANTFIMEYDPIPRKCTCSYCDSDIDPGWAEIYSKIALNMVMNMRRQEREWWWY